jgi:hypothetical protein
MAKVERNIMVRGWSGSVGGLVFRQMRDGSTWVSGTPDFSHRKFSKGQKNHQRRFKEAAAYARDAAKTQPIYAELAKGTVKNAYNIALSDWFNPPVVRRIERRAGKIRVEASDGVMVTKVRVTILNEEGAILETGEAKPEDPQKSPSVAGWWEYTAHADGKITAEAWDQAGNVGRLVE